MKTLTRTKPFDFANCTVVDPLAFVIREVEKRFDWGQDDDAQEEAGRDTIARPAPELDS